MVRVSAVVATFNRGYIVGDAIQSILGQIRPADEIIVVDDGSTDDTAEVISRFSGIRYIRQDKNRGCSAAYNACINNATGDLIAFLDSDDIWDVSFLERTTRAIERSSHLTGVFTDTRIQGENFTIPSLFGILKYFSYYAGPMLPDQEYVLDQRALRLCLFQEVPIKPSALLVNRQAILSCGGFDETWPSGTDWDLFIKMSRKYQFAVITSQLVLQRQTDDATHQIFSEADKNFIISVLHRERQIEAADKAITKAIRRGLYSCYKHLGYMQLHSNRPTLAASTYLKGFCDTLDSRLLLRSLICRLPKSILYSLPKVKKQKVMGSGRRPTRGFNCDGDGTNGVPRASS